MQNAQCTVYAYEIYDGLKPADAAGLEMATAFLRDGRVVYQSPFTPVTTPPRRGGKVRAIPIAGKLALGADMAPGPYTLEVIVRGKDAKKLVRKQWLDFGGASVTIGDRYVGQGFGPADTRGSN
jgi:hypothetical protein